MPRKIVETLATPVTATVLQTVAVIDRIKVHTKFEDRTFTRS